jgi:hypothetical protein
MLDLKLKDQSQEDKNTFHAGNAADFTSTEEELE